MLLESICQRAQWPVRSSRWLLQGSKKKVQIYIKTLKYGGATSLICYPSVWPFMNSTITNPLFTYKLMYVCTHTYKYIHIIMCVYVYIMETVMALLISILVFEKNIFILKVHE